MKLLNKMAPRIAVATKSVESQNINVSLKGTLPPIVSLKGTCSCTFVGAAMSVPKADEAYVESSGHCLAIH